MPAAIPFILAATAIAGTGLAVAGTVAQAKAAKSQNQYQRQIIEDQQRQEALRQQAMELDNRRRQREAVRQAQKARSVALAAASNQGAQFGSGIQGGFGQIQGVEGTNLLGLSQSLALGRANFGLSGDITQNRIGAASSAADYSFGQSLNSLGGGLIQSMGAIGRLGGMFGTGYGAGAPSSAYGADAYNAYGAQGGYAY